MENFYYTPPSDEIFEEIKKAAMAIWSTYDDQFGYATGKLDRIMTLENVSDNAVYMIAMFDHSNQAKLAKSLSVGARYAVRERMLAGGAEEDYIVF